MKSSNTSCCETVGPKRKIKNIPENPVVKSGVELSYLGAGAVKFKGKKTGNTYYAANPRRHIAVAEGDEATVLNKKDLFFSLKYSLKIF